MKMEEPENFKESKVSDYSFVQSYPEQKNDDELFNLEMSKIEEILGPHNNLKTILDDLKSFFSYPERRHIVISDDIDEGLRLTNYKYYSVPPSDYKNIINDWQKFVEGKKIPKSTTISKLAKFLYGIGQKDIFIHLDAEDDTINHIRPDAIYSY